MGPFLSAHAAHSDWRVAVADCQRQLRPHLAAHAARGGAAAPFTLGWCYLSDHYALAAEAILAELQRDLPDIAWVGTVGVGVAAGKVEYVDEGALALMLAPLPRTSFRIFSGRQPLPAQTSGFVAHTALVHAEGSTPDLQDLLQELSARTATGYLFGGLAAARTRTLHLAEGVLSGGLSGVLFSSAVGLISRVTQGCQPIGPVRTVTAAENNCVLRLDGRPALDCVVADLGLERGLPVALLARGLAGTLVGLSRGMDDRPQWPGQFGADTLVRHLVGVDPGQGVLAIGDAVEAGMRLAFCRRDPEAALADLVRVATEVRAELEGGAAGRALGALYVSCSGRGGGHFGSRHAELRTLAAAVGEMPLVGFFAGGEIARDRLYGYTGVLTVFTDPG